MLVLSTHIRVKNWMHSLGHFLKQHTEHFLLLLHIWRVGNSPGHDFLRRKVVDHSQIRLTPGLSKLSDISPELDPGMHSLKIAFNQVLVLIVGYSFERAIRSSSLTSDGANQSEFAHHLPYSLAVDHSTLFMTQAHRNLPVTAAIGGSRENLHDVLSEFRSGWLQRMFAKIVIG